MAAAWRRERPHGFQEAFQVAREMLSASPELVAKGSIDAEAEQLVVAAYRIATGKLLSRMELFSRMQDRFPVAAGEKLLTLAGSRAEGKTLQHLTGVQAFLDHEYDVGPDVLVPRPETEFLVMQALEELGQQPRVPLLGIEIGIGSGAISVELLSALPGLRMLASELTPEAEKRAWSNARRILGAEAAAKRLVIQRAVVELEVWEPFVPVLQGRKADFVISNPPYLIASDPIEDEVRKNEPGTALFAPEADPLHFYRIVANTASQHVVAGGLAFMELAPERAAEVLRLFSASGWNAKILADLAGRDRVLVASLPGKR